ncbi:MAG: ABC transporter permease [Tannerella sp.]|jgi:putative ABC transport system permease protein|nr:ABC transporter permease [Tannerella sp.]
MKRTQLLRANIACYLRFYKLIALAVLIAQAVVTGSLTVGASVRATLVKRVNERLGRTETVLFAGNSFFDDRIGLEGSRILLGNGFISDAGRLLPVMVWGTDEYDIPAGGAKMNEALAAELSSPASGMVLRLPATGLVPSGSLFVTGNYTTAIRLSDAGRVEVERGGNLSLKNEQSIPRNLFVNRAELASLLGVAGKVNLILSEKHLSAGDVAAAWTPAHSGLRENRTGDCTEISSDRIFIPYEAVETLRADNPGANRLFSYLANGMEHAGHRLSYAFATAVDRYRGRTLAADELILSDYTAAHLHAQVDDTVRLTYYTSADLKTLHEDTIRARVAAIVPLQEWLADTTLSADFPGLTDMENCTGWDSDLPIDMSLVTREDEDYWAKYRATPKVILSFQAVGDSWRNAYGSATAVRFDAARGRVETDGLTPAMFGLQALYPREAALKAARNGVDFSSLFLSLGFFIILSAFLLMLVPLSEMMYRRKDEIRLLAALGYPRKRILRLFLREAAPVALLASLPGIAAGVCYTWLVLILLGSLWKGATHTGGFILFPDVPVLLAGTIVSLGIALLLLRITIARSLKQESPRTQSLSFRWNRPFGRSKLIRASLYANRKRALLSFFTLAAGVGIVFSVGLNRRGFTDSRQLLSGTGGYTLWCESSVPIYHNIATPQGRDRLALTELPEHAQVLQLLRYRADDASCLNLNRVSQPTVLGVDMERLKSSDFKIRQSIYPDGAPVFDMVQSAVDSVYPVLIDGTTLAWGLMLKPGDTVYYESGRGKRVGLRLAGVLDNSVFQGNVLLDKTLFSELWGEITGSEIILFKVDGAGADQTRQLVSQALSEYGVSVTGTAGRLAEFNSVTDTYLSIFLTLGGIGLLLGVAGFIIVVRKDLVSRKKQIALYRSLGFTRKRIASLLFRESVTVPLSAILAGVAVSLACVVSGLANVGFRTWITVGVLTLLLIGGVLVFVKQQVKKCVHDACTG